MEFDTSNIDYEWNQLLIKLTRQFDKPPDLQGILFLIGVQELGKGVRSFTKEEKTDLMHIAICKLLSQCGYYEFEGNDDEGWPHWKLVRNIDEKDFLQQENLLKKEIINYFENKILSSES